MFTAKEHYIFFFHREGYLSSIWNSFFILDKIHPASRRASQTTFDQKSVTKKKKKKQQISPPVNHPPCVTLSHLLKPLRAATRVVETKFIL